MATASITISIQPKSEDEAREVATLKRNYELLARRITGGGPTSLFRLQANMLVEKVAQGIEPFTALEETNRDLVALFEEHNPLPRR